MTVLPDLRQQNAELQAKLEAMAALLAVANKPKAITLKVSEKGALSIYGLGRFPVTLYRGQIERLLSAKPQIEAFISANAKLFATKD